MDGSTRPAILGLAALAVVVALVWLLARENAVAPGSTPANASEGDPAAARTAELQDARDIDPVRTPADDDAGTPAPAPADPAPTELRGRVIRKADRSPIPGADVRLLHRDADEFWNLDLEYGARIDELGRTTSDADGRFRFDVARARVHRLAVYANGFARRTVVDCTGGSGVVVELGVGATIEGTVRCGGEPMVDVPLRIGVEGESLELAAGRTGPDGTFRFPHLQPYTVFVQVQPPDHPEEWKRVVLEEGGLHRVEIDVPIGRSLTGTVHDAESRIPIAGAEISDSWTFKRAARSDTDGTFTLRGIDDGGLEELYVRAPGYAGTTRSITGKPDEPVHIELVQGGEVTGRVLTADGTPPPRVYVGVGASFMLKPGIGHTDWIRARVAGDGIFVARGLRPDQHYWLYVRARGYGTRVYVLPKALGSGERTDVGDVVVRPAGGVEGRVVDEQGEPIAGISVSIDGTNADSRAWHDGDGALGGVSQFESRSLETDARGRFRFTDLAAGGYTVSASPRGRYTPITHRVDTTDGVVLDGIELVVPTGGVIAGTIRYADGRAPGDEASDLLLISSNGGSSRVASDGRFRFEGLVDGRHTISTLRHPAGWVLSPRRDVPTGTEDLVLELQPAAKIAGRVVDAEGEGIRARVFVSWKVPTGGSPFHSTGDDGRFEIEVPPDFVGSVHAMILDGPMAEASVEDVTAGRTDLELCVRAPGTGR